MDGQDCFNALLERFEDIVKANTRLQVQVEDYATRLSTAEQDNKFLVDENKSLAKMERFVELPAINELFKAFLTRPAKGPDGEDLPF